jgi:hypothetical protein
MTLTEKYRADLIALIDRYKLVFGASDSAISFGAFPKNSEFVRRLRRGENVNLYNAEKMEAYIEKRTAELREFVAARPERTSVSEKVHEAREAKGKHSASGRSEKSRPFTEEDRAEYWGGRESSPYEF